MGPTTPTNVDEVRTGLENGVVNLKLHGYNS